MLDLGRERPVGLLETRVDQAARGLAQQTGEVGRQLLVMGANATGVAWPMRWSPGWPSATASFATTIATPGRSTRAFAERPYPLTHLAHDTLAVLDGFGVDRAHVVGMSLGGMLVQLLLLDARDRIMSATLFSTGALAGDPALPGEDELPGPSEDVLARWEHLGASRTREQEIAFSLEHWRLLSGAAAGGHFDPDEFRALEERARAHTGHDDPIAAHALADQSDLARGRQLAGAAHPRLSSTRPSTPSIRCPTQNISPGRSRQRAA